jgi:hypothetical protein
MEITEVEKSWMAGFLDADGMVTINKHSYKLSYELIVTAANSDKNACQVFLNYFGGCITESKRNLVLYQYLACANKAHILLQTLLPYLKVKKERAEIGIALQERIVAYNRAGKHILTEEEIQIREELFIRMRFLINRGNTRPGSYSMSNADRKIREVCGLPLPRG